MLRITVVLSALLAIAHCQGQDLTTQAGANGSAVVSACISRIEQSGIFTSNNEMLRRIAYVETSNGNDEDTYRSGYDGGIWAVDENLFDATQNTASYSVLTNLHQQIQSTFSIQWSSVEWNDLRKPLYSALAARLYFYTVSASIPISSNIQSQATYWVTYYNPSGSASNFVTLVNELVAQDQCSVSGIDIYFVLDESGSVGSSNYQLMKQFVYDTVDEFDIGSDETQVGVISYSSSAIARFYLNTYHDKATLLAAINALPFNSGLTNTAAAINLLRTNGFTSTNGGRPQSQAIPRVAVVITDGHSNSYTATVTAAQNAHDEDITIFAVGVGSGVNNNELDAIASDPSYVSTLTGFDTSQFDALQTTIVNEACTTSAAVEINETIDTSVGEGEQTYIEIPYDPDEGVTIKVNVTNGTVVVYASDQTTTPNEAFHDWMIETDGYSDVFLDPDDVNRTVGDTVYVAIEGEDTDNDFTFTSENGDTSTRVSAPQNVTIEGFTATTVTVSWTPPTIDNPDIIIQYNIELSEEQFGLSTVRASTTGTSVTVTGLEEYNTYECKVASVSSSGAGPFSSPINFTTMEAVPAAAPQSPSGNAQSPSVITLEWDPPPEVDINGDIEYYVVEVEEVYTGRMWTFHAVDVHINVGSLHAYYVYKCRIAAFTIGQGPFTNYYNVYSGEKAPTAAPENVTVVDDSPSSVDLTWDAPPYEMQNGRIRHYNVEITTVETGDVLEVTSNYSNITVNGLLPFYNYTCTVSAETVADGPSSDEISFILPEGPPDGAPENVTGSATSSTSIRLTWDTPARNLQNGYIVEYRVIVTETNTGMASTSTVTDRSLTLTSLHPYYIYSCSVAAVTVGIGPYSVAINVTTDEDVPIGPPQNFTALPTSPFMADLSWSPPLDDEQNGVIINYVINITEDDTGYEFQLSTSNTVITVDNLRPYYTYTCVIGAETSVGLGPYSSSIDFRTHEYIPSEPQLNVSRSVGEPNELLATWTVPEDPNGIILNYTVYCDETVFVEGSGLSGEGDLMLDISESNTPTVIVVVPGSDLSVVVMELTPYTYYNCYVTANTSVGEGNSSMVQLAQTDESEPGDAPTNFNLFIINSTAIRLTWDEPLLPYGVLLSYTIKYNTSNGNISRVVNSTEPRDIIIAELQEHTWYRFEIVASTRIGDGPYAYLTARTDISEPHAPPSNITFEVDSSTQTTISWQPPPFEDQNGPILYYNLIISDQVFGLDDIDDIVTSLSYTVTGLEEYNNYTFIIAAATVVGIGPYSNPVIFTTEQDIPSAPPTTVTGDVQSSTFVVFTWLEPPSIDQNGIIQYYVVKVREIESGILWTFFAVDEDISIGSLHPYYYYDCTVAAHTIVGTGPYSAAIRVQTEEAAPSGPPLQLMSLKTSNSLILSWDPPLNESQNGIIRSYVIQILEDDTSTTTTHYSNNTLLTVNNLHPYYTYKCSVAAFTVGLGPYSAILTVQLDEDRPTAAPINSTGFSPSSTSITLSWNLPPFEHRNGIIRSYIINSIELETNISSNYTSLGTTLTINSLHPYYRYQFTIAAVTIIPGPHTAAFTIRTQEDAPSSAAENTSVDSTTATSIYLSWEPPEDDQKNGIILRYIIRVVPVNGGTTIYLNSTETSATVTSLRPYTLYDCSIAAATSVGRGPFSSAITVRTDEAAPSASPQNLTGTSVNSQTISLSWSPPPSSDTNGIIREYRVNVTEVETGVMFFLTTASTSITLQSLHPYYNYRCIVSAYTVGVGPYTAVFNIRTPEDVPSGFPQSFSVESTSSRSALLTWNPPNSADQNGIIIEYTINVSAVETGEEFQLTSRNTSITVTTLRPYTTYQCIIAASTSVGIGPFSTIVTILTPEDVPTSAPQDPNGYAVSSNSIFLSWDPPPVLERHGIIREYQINLTEQETGTLTTYTSMETFIEISRLHPFYNYTWIVTAVTIGEGPYTASDTVMTHEDVPSGAPLNFSATEITSTSFNLVWELPAPSERNGIITGYNISVTSLNSPLEDPQKFFTTSLSITVNSLDPHTDYICIIAANTAIGTGPFSFEMNIRTEQDVPSSAPSNTTGMALDSTRVYLSWDPPPPDEINGVIQGYRINITELDTGDMLQHTAEGTNTTIGSLHPHYTYNFTIAAFTLIGNGPTTYVVIRTAEAAPSSAPTAFQASASNPTSIYLSWSPPPMEDQNGIIRHYEVTLIALETGEIHIRTSTALFITVASLRPYTTYNCTIAAETVATGPTTSGMLVRTLQAAPSAPPDDVQVTAGDSRTLQLSWQPPSNRSRNGIIQRYVINITELETSYSFQLETTDLFVVANDLHPYYQYSCSVAAETVGLGPFSVAVIIQLPEDAPSSPPMRVSISTITSTSFYLSWNDLPSEYQNGLIRYYIVNITELDTGIVLTYTTTTTDFTAQFLHPYYYYMCSVSAVTISPGPYSDFQVIQTEIDVPSGPPQSTDSLAMSSTSLVLTWDLPLLDQQNGPIVGYSVRVTRVNNGDIFEWDTNNTVVTIDSLVPYTLYEWRVAAQTIAGTGPFSSPVTEQTLPDAPDDAPQDVQNITVESRLIELMWSPPPADAHNGEIVHYIIDYTEVQTGRTSVTMSSNTAVTLGNLHPFYEYSITVTAFTVDFGPPSTPITVQTLEDAPSAPPTDLLATALSARTLNITWEAPVFTEQNGIIRSYRLNISVTETGSSELLMSDQPQLLFEDLHPFYTYSFLIAAVTISPGPYSEILTIQMPQAAPISSPQNVSVNVISSEAISVTWDPPLDGDQNGIITSYTIRLYDIVADQTTLYRREGHHSQFVIDTLHPYYEYDVSVAAETVDIGPFSVIKRVQTLEDLPSDAPQNLTVVATDSRSLLLTWLPPPPDTQNGVIQQYIITISVRETRDSFVLFSNDEQFMFNLAHPYYTYTISVAAETIGTGPYGEEFTIRTPEDVPTGTPRLVEAVAVSSSSIRITWIPPPEEEQNGVIRSYFINVTELQTGNIREIEAYGDESIQIVNQLHPFYTYECAIAAFTVGLGPAAFTQTMTYPAVPSFVPLNVDAESLNATHALLSWDPPPPEHQNGVIEQYHITIKVTETGELLQRFSTYNSTVIGQLHPFYTYMFSVAAQTVAVGPFSSQITLKMPEAAPSGVVGNVSVEVQSASSVIISWLPPDIRFWNGIVTSYTVIYENKGLVGGNTDDDGSGLQPFIIQSITISGLQLANIQDPGVVPLPLQPESVLIDQLEEYHIYSFAVQQANDEGVSLLSEAALQEMPEAAPAGSPTNVVIKVLSSTSVIIKWETPELLLRNGIITKYHLRVTLASNNTVQRYTVPATVLSVPIEGVQKYSKVSVQIAAETSVGVGPFSDPVSALTDQDFPPTPKNPESKVLNETAVSLVWYTPDSPNGIILEYQVIYYGYKPLSDPRKRQESDIEILDGPKIINVPAKEEENSVYNLTINDLVPGLAYTIKLRARTNVGYGENITLVSTQPVSGSDSSSQSSSLSEGTAVVIVLAILAVIGWILVIALIVFFANRYRSSRKKDYRVAGNEPENEMGFINPVYDQQDKSHGLDESAYHDVTDGKASMRESYVEKDETDEKAFVEEPQPDQVTKL